jgi:hypothetical protein
VQAIFALHLELGSLLPVVEELGRRGWHLKQWTTREGKIAGGNPSTRPRLHQLLTNIIYTGQVRHRGEIYPGEHEAIIGTRNAGLPPSCPNAKLTPKAMTRASLITVAASHLYFLNRVRSNASAMA